MQITDRRTVPEAASKPALTFKTAENTGGQMLALDDAEGIVTAIVSVTGTEDEVADIIVPGAYRATLLKRRPKVCWAHSWEHPIGRVLHIEEIHPGDDRLPAQTKDGQPWPREAGALVATMQFNMRSREGKDAFEAVRFYSETGECEYSIGYQVPAGKSTRDNRGVRHIKALELYELSVVLFGAHTMTGTIDVKSAIEVAASTIPTRATAAATLAALMEGKSKAQPKGKPQRTSASFKKCPRCGGTKVGHLSGSDQPRCASCGYHVPLTEAAKKKALPTQTVPPLANSDTPVPPVKDAQADEDPAADESIIPDPEPPTLPDFSDGVMVALYPDPAAADAIVNAISGPDATMPREDLHVTLAYLGHEGSVTMGADQVVKHVTDALEGEGALTGSLGGIGMFPPGDNGVPVYVPVDVPGLGVLRETIVGALGDAVDNEHGFTPHMTIGYDLGRMDPLPSIPVTFDRVRVVYGDQHRDITLSAPVDADGNPWEVPDPDQVGMGDAKALTMHLTPRQVAAVTAALDGWEGKAGGADRNRGGAEKLRRYWTTGPGGAEIGWGTSGDFTRCTALLEEHMPGRAEGYCANRHKEMTGMWPGDKGNKADAYDPALDGTVLVTETKHSPSGKGYPRLAGSMEEQQDALREAVTEALRGMEHEDGRWEWPGVSVDATFPATAAQPAYLVATRDKYDGADTRESFTMTWHDSGDGIVLGNPEPVELEVSVVFGPGEGPFHDGDEPETAYDASEWGVADDMPFADDLLRLAGLMKAANRAAVETKAGRVLSGANERRLRQAAEELVSVLAAAGVRIHLSEVDLDDDEDGKPESMAQKPDARRDPDPMVDVSTTSPSADGTKSAEGTVVLDRASLDAALAALALD